MFFSPRRWTRKFWSVAFHSYFKEIQCFSILEDERARKLLSEASHFHSVILYHLMCWPARGNLKLNWFLKLKISKFELKPLIFNRSSIFQRINFNLMSLNLGRKVLLAFKLFQSVLYGKMSDPPLIDSSDCYATWSGPVPLSNEDRGAATASKGKTVGFEKQNSVDQDMVRMGASVLTALKYLAWMIV